MVENYFSLSFYPTSNIKRIHFLIFFKDFIYIYESERERAWVGCRGRGRGRSRLIVEDQAWCGARSHNAGITPWAEGRRLTTVPPMRPHMISFSDWLISLNIILSSSIHVVANGKILFFLWLNDTPLFICTRFLYPFINQWALGLLPYLGYCK